MIDEVLGRGKRGLQLALNGKQLMQPLFSAAFAVLKIEKSP